jgi:uncharacterized protein (TIGR03118 family)
MAAGYTVVPLAASIPGVAPATDANLVNPWGISFSPTGPFWFADNGSGVSDLVDGRGQQIPLIVTVPGSNGSLGEPTGTVFNPGNGFVVSKNGVAGASQFLFATENGTIAGWAPGADLTQAIVAVDNSSLGAVYKGLALATDLAGHSFLYAADFQGSKIDVFDKNFHVVQRPGAFEDSTLPADYAPFNIQNIGNLLYVIYAQRDAEGYDQVDGAGHGFIDVFTTDGSLVRRFASGGALNSPWGLAIAPAGFGSFGGALLVGNTGDGHISAYDPQSGVYLGQLADDSGQPISIPILWALTFGNGHMGGDANTLFFAAGLNGDEEHGLFGAIQSPQGRARDTAGAGTFDPSAPGERADYPLPPSSGPALRNDDMVRSTTVSMLLPSSASSLAMIPTLYTVSQASPTNEVLPPVGPFVTATFTRGTSTLVTAGTVLVSSDLPSAGADTWDNGIALNSFLDLNASTVNARDAGVGEETDNSSAIFAMSASSDQETPPFRQKGQVSFNTLQSLENPPLLVVELERFLWERSETVAAADHPSPSEPARCTTVVDNVFAGVCLAWTCSLLRRNKARRDSDEQVMPALPKTLVTPHG